MGARKRRPSPAPAPPAGAEPEPPRGSSAYYARQRARDEAARAALVPLAPGERPRAVTIAAVVAVLLAISNVVLLATGWEVNGERPQLAGTLLFSAVMLVGAAAMWRGRYWAVLGFQALLAITILFAFLALLTASNVRAVVLCVAIMALAGPLFWFLVKAMARLQLPRRATR
jgi:hypothetical protein